MRYYFLFFIFLIPTRICSYNSLRRYHPFSSPLIAMVPPPDGDKVSKMTDKAISPHGCQVTSKTVFHPDGSSTERETLQCTKETKRDKNGRIVKKDDTNKGAFASGQKTFFDGLESNSK